jgi:hypothetical protein
MEITQPFDRPTFLFGSHRSRDNHAFRRRESGPAEEVTARWRHLAEEARPFDRPTSVWFLCSADISRPAVTVLELFALFEIEKRAVCGNRLWVAPYSRSTLLFVRSTPVCFWCSVEILRRALSVFELLAFSHFDKTLNEPTVSTFPNQTCISPSLVTNKCQMSQ